MINYLSNIAPYPKFTFNGQEYNSRYFLAHGIYPNWILIMKTISSPEGEKRKWYCKMQEGSKKDGRRAFGVLQAHHSILKQGARL